MYICNANIGILTRAFDSIMSFSLSRFCSLFVYVPDDCQEFSQLFSTDSAGWLCSILYNFRFFSKLLSDTTFYRCLTLDYFNFVHALFNIPDFAVVVLDIRV